MYALITPRLRSAESYGRFDECYVRTYVRAWRSFLFIAVQSEIRREAGWDQWGDRLDDKPSDRILIIDQLLIDQL